jgi:predicted RNA-binding protein YlxR (DUF448 family)
MISLQPRPKLTLKKRLLAEPSNLKMEADMNDRTCIVTREAGSVDDMIRFVAGPDGSVVADLKHNLPGRGCWVKAQRRYIDEAVKRKLFPRGLKTAVTVPDDFGQIVDQMLVKSALGSFGLARKAGVVITGAAKVDIAIRNGTAGLVLHAFEAAEDGVRKLDQARRSVVYADGPDIPALSLFSSDEMDLALGGVNVIHAAVLRGRAAAGLMKRVWMLQHFRVGLDEQTSAKAATAAKETETE